MEKETGNRVSSIFLAFLAGTAIGVAVGMILAPYAGKEAREKILRTAADIASKAAEAARKAKEEAEAMLDRIKEIYRTVERGGSPEG